MALDWDDLRFYLAILRAGSLPGAADRLGVTASTVYRRLDSLERALDVRLIERGGRGLALTPAGEELQQAAEAMDETAARTINSLAGRDLEPAGSVRITAPDDLAEAVVMPILKEFLERHPRISVELVTDNRFLNLTRREADIAVRPTRQPPETLLGRRVAPVRSAIFAPAADRAMVSGAASSKDSDLKSRPWLAWEEGLGPEAHARWLIAEVPAQQIRLRVNSMSVLQEAAAQGLGLAILPCHLGDPDPRLVRLEPPRACWDSELRVLTHPGLRSVARIRLLIDSLYQALSRQAGLFAGELA